MKLMSKIAKISKNLPKSFQFVIKVHNQPKAIVPLYGPLLQKFSIFKYLHY